MHKCKRKKSLNITKNELVLLKSARKQTGVPLKLNFNGSKLYHANFVKHLGIKNDEKHIWK